MTRSGGHRVRSVARWVATPTLLATTAFVAYASLRGDLMLLRIAAAAALVIGVAAVVLFDTELIRNRRHHGADRASLAKSYAETYAAHIRVTSAVNETKPVEIAPVQITAAETTDAADAPVTPLVAAAPKVESAELWEHMRDAPTVVDLIAYEERARLNAMIEAAEKKDAEAAAAAERKIESA